ncbi:MAG: hypothetical protein MZU84_00540 [Sphingobacterium sp.]|nr:hypothetical protein [Sphingobacterium sp.]
MACWDLCGKALGVPVWQLLGGRYRDKVRIYADTPEDRDPKVELEKIKETCSGGRIYLAQNGPGNTSGSNPDGGCGQL